MLDLRLFGGNSFFYPVKDNILICFKLLEPSDRDRYLEGYKKLSPDSIYHRFFGFKKELTDKQIDEFLNTDNRNHIAWTAFDIVDEEPVGIGVARFKRSQFNPEEAELGLTVIDQYQNMGVGTVLLAVMYYLSGIVQIKTLTGIILADNVRLIRRFHDLGATFSRRSNEYEMRLPVHRNFQNLPKTRYAQEVIPILSFLRDNNFCA